MASSTPVRISLDPKPGFCVKSSALASAILTPQHSPALLEPAPSPISVPKGIKVFVNIAWDSRVPAPPEASEHVIQRAMQGEDLHDSNPSPWYVPVIVSNAKQDNDKAGNPSLVFDCVFNPSIKARTLRDPDFKLFLTELSLQRIEAQSGLNLSRNIATPNILSKGKLLPRTVQIPAAMIPALVGAPASARSISTPSPTGATSEILPLIQQISTTKTPSTDRVSPLITTTPTHLSDTDAILPGLRGILKKPAPGSSSSTSPSSTIKNASQGPVETSKGAYATRPLEWSWSKLDSGRLRIQILVPRLTSTLVQKSILDIEPRRLTLSVPNLQTLDIDVSPSDAEIAARIGILYASTSPPIPASAHSRDTRKEEATSRTLLLKRQRNFDVDGAEAEWTVGAGMVVVYL